MSENNEDFVGKDICSEKHKAVEDKLIGLKANIHTSKESLSNRLDEVDVALLGDIISPGGLLRDFVDIKNEFTRHEEEMETKFKYHKEAIAKDLKFIGWKTWIAVGISVIALGGKFFGISINSIKGLFPEKTTPVVTTAPDVEDNYDNTIPIEVREFVNEENK